MEGVGGKRGVLQVDIQVQAGAGRISQSGKLEAGGFTADRNRAVRYMSSPTQHTVH